MHTAAKIESSGYFDLGKVITWFINLRWIASAGVGCALLVAQIFLRFDLPYSFLYILTGALFLANLVFNLLRRKRRNDLSERRQLARQFHLQISSDFLFLFLLIYFTGFFQNPLIYYFIFHLMLASFIFPKRRVYAYLVTLVVLIVAVSFAEYFRVLPHFALSGSEHGMDEYYSDLLLRCFALVSTIVIATYLITSIKERIEERGEVVELELDRYKSLERVKSQFILQVTHELRGPVAAIKGYHEMMLKGITGEIPVKTQNTLDRANRRTNNLLMIIDEMLDFAYMKSEEDVTKEAVQVDLGEVFRNNLDLLTPFARQRQVTLQCAVPKGLVLTTNRDLINIILGNLISNAVKYSPNGGVVLAGAEQEGEGIRIHVSDDGMGIEPEELEKIFEEFYRSRRARKIENDGTGLGLSIVQKAVTVLGGRISVYSEIEKGTRIQVHLPATHTDQIEKGAFYGQEQSTDH
jgi:signal transduction histidine kinase